MSDLSQKSAKPDYQLTCGGRQSDSGSRREGNDFIAVGSRVKVLVQEGVASRADGGDQGSISEDFNLIVGKGVVPAESDIVGAVSGAIH